MKMNFFLGHEAYTKLAAAYDGAVFDTLPSPDKHIVTGLSNMGFLYIDSASILHKTT